MSILGMRNDKDQQEDDNFIIPSVIKEDAKEITLEKAIAISTIAHPVVIGFLWLFVKLLILILAMLGIVLPLFDMPKPKPRDIEFVLVNKPEQTPINKHTRYRADRNTRAGGKHDPRRAVSEPEPKSASATPQQKQSSPAKQTHPAPRPQAQKPQPRVAERSPVLPPRPTLQREIPRPSRTAPNAFSIPVPRSKSPKSYSSYGGPVTSAPTGSYGPSSSSPSPVMSSSGSRGSSGRSRYSNGYSVGGGNAGNPGPGNPNGSPGIDAIKEPDFGPYMRELQRRIKRNWDPPKGNESKRVVLMFTVGKDGRLLSMKVLKSSGVTSADEAAKEAVSLTAPFKPLPPEYKGSDIDIQFTFDYNVFGVGGSRY